MFELNSAVDESEQGVVAADTYTYTRTDGGAALSYDDVAGGNVLTVSLLGAETLRLGVTTVLGRTYTFFMCKEL
jgi:hypothetical protein